MKIIEREYHQNLNTLHIFLYFYHFYFQIQKELSKPFIIFNSKLNKLIKGRNQ